MKGKSVIGKMLLSVLLIFIIAVSALYNLDMLELYKFPVLSGSDAIISDTDESVISQGDIVSETEPTEPEPEPEPLPPDCVTIQMGGDVLLHDRVNKAAKTGKNTYDYSSYFSLFDDVFVSDLNIINLEGPTDAYGENNKISGFPIFNMPYEILPALKGINVDLCVTANNHTCDKGYTGVKNTLKNVKKAGMDSVGSYITKEDSEKCYITEINNIKVGVAAFASYTEGSVKKDKAFCVDKCGKKEKDVLASICPAVDKLKENGAEFIVVSIHWGVEYESAPTSAQKKIAKKLCEYGVDVIMGSHSHCVQPIEVLTVQRGGVESKALVIYSLGNLFTNMTAKNMARTQEGMVVSVKAVRGEDGCVRLDDAFYMPTFTYIGGTKGKNYMRIVPAGEYNSVESRPSFFKDASGWKKCKKAWTNTIKTVGKAIPSITDPSAYPEGFFTPSKELSSSDITI